MVFIQSRAKIPAADYGKTGELSIIRIYPKKAHHFRSVYRYICSLYIITACFCKLVYQILSKEISYQ